MVDVCFAIRAIVVVCNGPSGPESNVHRITHVVVLGNYRLELTFSDGQHGVVDLSGLVGKGVFALWKDYEAFRQVAIGPNGDLVWSDQVDLCPDALYLQMTGQKP